MENFCTQGASVAAQLVKNPPAMRRPGFDLWVGKISWRRERLPTPVFCLENPMHRGAWWAAVRGVAKSWIRLKRLSIAHRDVYIYGDCGMWFSLVAQRAHKHVVGKDA